MMKSILAITKGLSDPSRVRMLFMLRERELCVCQIIEVLGLAPSTVSKHLALLVQANLVHTRKEGRWVHCRLPAPADRSGAVAGALEWLFAAASREPMIKSDAKLLRRALCVSPEELYQIQLTRREAACCDSDCQ